MKTIKHNTVTGFAASRSVRPREASTGAADGAAPLLPNFFVVGVAKAGTTPLYYYLKQHPDVYLPECKEPHFFDYNWDKGFDHYRRTHFFGWNGERAVGEMTPSYLALPFVADRIEQHVPHAKLIAVLRHPVDRAYAHWWMIASKGYDKLSFEEAVKANLSQLEAGASFEGEKGIERWRQSLSGAYGSDTRVRTMIEAGYYARHLECYYRHFSPEQIKVILTEDLHSDTRGTVREIWRFLGVDTEQPLHDQRRRNDAYTGLAIPAAQVARTLRIKNLLRCLPAELRFRVKNWLSATGRRSNMDLNTRQMLVEHYRPHNDALSELIGRDLSAWK